jgi:hypothetical protein
VDGEDCETCHVDVAETHVAAPHGSKGIACRQCHRGGGHPEFDQALNDGTCGGCHLAEYHQSAQSAHARDAFEIAPGGDDALLRDNDFRVLRDGRAVFVTQHRSAPQQGLLCAGCHYDAHRVSADAARAAGFCEVCHGERAAHYDDAVADGNRCIGCHMGKGTTMTGQPVTSHAFSVDEVEESER